MSTDPRKRLENLGETLPHDSEPAGTEKVWVSDSDGTNLHTIPASALGGGEGGGGTDDRLPDPTEETEGKAVVTDGEGGYELVALGDAATADVDDFATAAQGALADTATQPGDLATVATSGSYNDLSDTPTLGTAAAADTGDFATAAQGALADTATQPGDLATVATSGDYDDLTNKPTLATVATSGSYDDLSDTPTLGTAAAADTDDFATATHNHDAAYDPVGTAAAAVVNAPIVCVWDGSAWSTLAGGEIPTSTSVVRHYYSPNDAEANTPTAYTVYDQWFGVSD